MNNMQEGFDKKCCQADLHNISVHMEMCFQIIVLKIFIRNILKRRENILSNSTLKYFEIFISGRKVEDLLEEKEKASFKHDFDKIKKVFMMIFQIFPSI